MASLLTPEFVAAAGLPADAEGQRSAIAAWHRRKTEIYTELVASAPSRPGRASPASWPRRWLRAGRWPSRRRQPNPRYA